MFRTFALGLLLSSLIVVSSTQAQRSPAPVYDPILTGSFTEPTTDPFPAGVFDQPKEPQGLLAHCQ